MEAIVLAIVCASPWAFGAIEPVFRNWVFLALASLLVLWALLIIVRWRVSWYACPVAMCLAATFMVGMFQIAPLPQNALAMIDPSKAELDEQLLPPRQELVIATENSMASNAAQSPIERSSRISVYPDATRNSLVNLLAVLVLFVIVRNDLATDATLKRLCFAAVLNATLLALFGLIQFFSSPEPGQVYWKYVTDGVVFGPFINRNHFAFYVNICIGLGVALLGLSRKRRRTSLRTPAAAVAELLSRPLALWICCGLGLMLSGVVLCLSRGGFLALLCATAACVVVRQRQRGSSRRIGIAAIGGLLAAGLLVWFGLDPVVERLATLWTGEAYSLQGGGRVFLLYHSWPLVSDFPLFGTGFGTFRFIEPMWFHTPENVGTVYRHAHNDYLEDMIEGGIFRLGIRVLAIWCLFNYALKAIRSKDSAANSVALGLLFGLVTIVVHSFFEFGLHVPAIASLAAVVAAHLCRVGSEAERKSGRNVGRQGTRKGDSRAMMGGVAPIVAASTAVLLAWFLYTHGSRERAVEDLRQEAQAMREIAYAGDLRQSKEAALLQQAVLLKPRDAELHLLLADAHFDSAEKARQRRGSQMAEGITEDSRRALLHVFQARRCCPVLAMPHARLAANVHLLQQADTKETYMRRAKLTAPADPQLWYFCGLQELADNRIEQAVQDWKQSLLLSDQYLADILDRLAVFVEADEMIAMLPKKPHVLRQSAYQLFPSADARALRKPILEEALLLMNELPKRRMDADQWHLKAILLEELCQPVESIAALNAALAREPDQLTWRRQLANLLIQEDRLTEAQRELRFILGRDSTDKGVKQLLEQVHRRQAEGKSRWVH